MFDKIMTILKQFGDLGTIAFKIQEQITAAVVEFKEDRNKFVLLLEEIQYNWAVVKNFIDGAITSPIKFVDALKVDTWQEVKQDKTLNLKLFMPGKITEKVLPKVGVLKVDPSLTKYIGRDFVALITSAYGKMLNFKANGQSIEKWDKPLEDFLEEYGILMRLILIKKWVKFDGNAKSEDNFI